MMHLSAVRNIGCFRMFAPNARLRKTALFALVAVTFGSLFISAQPVNAARPNVVLIMTDDQGYGDLACLGNQVIKTPAIDKLHADSIRLTNFHVDPTCSPTRSALLTGRYSSRTGVWHTIMGRSMMHTDEYTLGEMFSANGYQTGVFGKWHLGDNFPCRPQDQGFQEVLVHGGGGVTQTPDYWDNKYFGDTYWHNGVTKKQTGYCTDIFFNGAMQFIEKNKEKPFFCYLPTNAAHGPFLVAKKYSDPYKKLGVPSPRAEFYGMITNIDENVARMRKHLKKLGLEKNTIFIYMTDNGTAAGMRGVRRRKKAPVKKKPPGILSARDQQIRSGFNAGMRGTKGSEFDGGHRVPFFIRWPEGGLTGGRDIGVITAHIDILPTLAELCKLKSELPNNIDGISLANPLRGIEEESWPKRTLVVHSQRVETPQKWRKAAVMTDRWRMVINGQKRELFDMSKDPGQKKNVSTDHPEVSKKLTAKYETWYTHIGERFKNSVRIGLGSPKENPARLTCHDWHTNDKPVPWNQGHIRKDLKANGFWAVNIMQAGTYEITLRTRPEHVKAKIPSGKARVQIGTVNETKVISENSTSITFRVELKPGKAKLQTWLEGKTGKPRGAYFVDVRLVK
jgi:arylsulfatase A-like enzyme